MKPAQKILVHNTDRGRAGFRWNYRERKVGLYLTLRCPLRVECVGRWLAWETMIRLEPRGHLTLARETHVWHPDTGRRVDVGINDFRRMHHSWADLRLKYREQPGHYAVVKDYVLGLVRERWVRGIRTLETGTAYIESVTVTGRDNGPTQTFGLPDLDLQAYHDGLMAVVRGCAEQGRFEPLVDWVTENSPEPISRLFTEPGPL